MQILGILVAVVFLALIYKWMFTSTYGSKEQKKKADDQAEGVIWTILSIPLLLLGFIISLFSSDDSQNTATPHSNGNGSSTSGSPDAQSSSQTSASNDADGIHAHVLGLGTDHSVANIKRCYRDRMKEYHPDKVTHLAPKFHELAEAEAKRINAAYDYFRAKLDFS